jgi:hypothetical protein
LINHTSNECYCGETYGSYGNATSQGRQCDIPCINNKDEICGGACANSIYKIDSNSCIFNSTTSVISTRTSKAFLFYNNIWIRL